MNTPQIIPVSDSAPAAPAIARGAEALARGELVVIPTETVYGLAADPRAPGAMDRLFEAKGRPKDKSIALFAASLDQVRAGGARVPPAAAALAARYCPGPLTLVLQQDGEWVGYRIPDHHVALELLRKTGNVLAVTSANRSGEPPAQTAAQAAETVGPFASVILDAGPARGGVPSTVVRVGAHRVEVLREGAVPAGEILRVVEERPE